MLTHSLSVLWFIIHAKIGFNFQNAMISLARLYSLCQVFFFPLVVASQTKASVHSLNMVLCSGGVNATLKQRISQLFVFYAVSCSESFTRVHIVRSFSVLKDAECVCADLMGEISHPFIGTFLSCVLFLSIFFIAYLH